MYPTDMEVESTSIDAVIPVSESLSQLDETSLDYQNHTTIATLYQTVTEVSPQISLNFMDTIDMELETATVNEVIVINDSSSELSKILPETQEYCSVENSNKSVHEAPTGMFPQ